MSISRYFGGEVRQFRGEWGNFRGQLRAVGRKSSEYPKKSGTKNHVDPPRHQGVGDIGRARSRKASAPGQGAGRGVGEGASPAGGVAGGGDAIRAAGFIDETGYYLPQAIQLAAERAGIHDDEYHVVTLSSNTWVGELFGSGEASSMLTKVMYYVAMQFSSLRF